MPGTLSPYPRLQFLDGNGDPYAAAQLFSYEAGTSTKVATYTDQALTTPNTNPIVLDSAGRALVFLDPSLGSVKYVLAPSDDTDPPASPIYTVDNIAPVPIYSIVTTLDQSIVDPSWSATDNNLTLLLPRYQVLAHSEYTNAAGMSDGVDIPAGALSADGDTLIVEWETDYSSATLSARSTMFGSNVDLGTGGATTHTRARYVVSRIGNTSVYVSQTVIQSTATACAAATISSLNLTTTAYTITTGMASGTYTSRGSRVYYLPVGQWNP